mgnify:CR=1 FL=1
MNFNNIGQEVAIIKDNDEEKNTKICVYDPDRDKDKKSKLIDDYEKITLDDDEGYFQYVSDKKMDRDVIYICGGPGSGKSYWIKNYLENYFLSAYRNYPIYLISSKDEDTQLDKIKRVKRLTIDETYISNPIDYKSFEESLVIMDDIDSFKGKLKEEIYHLRDIIINNGRSYKINLIATTHEATGKINKIALDFSNAIVFFLRNYNNNLKYFLESYIGLDKKQIDELKNQKKAKGRSTVYIKRTYTHIIMQDNRIMTFNGILE